MRAHVFETSRFSRPTNPIGDLTKMHECEGETLGPERRKMCMWRKSAHVDMNHMYARLGERWGEGCFTSSNKLFVFCDKTTISTKKNPTLSFFILLLLR